MSTKNPHDPEEAGSTEATVAPEPQTNQDSASNNDNNQPNPNSENVAIKPSSNTSTTEAGNGERSPNENPTTKDNTFFWVAIVLLTLLTIAAIAMAIHQYIQRVTAKQTLPNTPPRQPRVTTTTPSSMSGQPQQPTPLHSANTQGHSAATGQGQSYSSSSHLMAGQHQSMQTQGNSVIGQPPSTPSQTNRQGQGHQLNTATPQNPSSATNSIATMTNRLLDDNEKYSSNIAQISNTGYIIGVSSIGVSHLNKTPQVPCQDNHAICDLGQGWGIAVVCDGAGSYHKSHEGSKFVSETLVESLERAVKHFGWKTRSALPEYIVWHDVVKGIFNYTYAQLIDYSKQKNYSDPEILSCTAIVTIYSPIGLLVSHIGDGRACYQDSNHQWHAMMKPFAGEDGGTAFLATDFLWAKLLDKMFNNNTLNAQELDKLKYACLDAFVESRVINEPVSAFALMSDGCEDYLYESKKRYDELGGKYLDTNTPKTNDLTQLVDHLNKQDSTTRKQCLAKILDQSPSFKQEPDDKTLILGVFNS